MSVPNPGEGKKRPRPRAPTRLGTAPAQPAACRSPRASRAVRGRRASRIRLLPRRAGAARIAPPARAAAATNFFIRGFVPDSGLFTVRQVPGEETDTCSRGGGGNIRSGSVAATGWAGGSTCRGGRGFPGWGLVGDWIGGIWAVRVYVASLPGRRLVLSLDRPTLFGHGKCFRFVQLVSPVVFFS